MSTTLAEIGKMGRIEEVETEVLRTDPHYQRDLSMDLVQKIARDWKDAAAGPIVVSKRKSGELYVVNGQHRLAAAKLLGLKTIPAQVIPNMTMAQEADLRLKTNVRLGDRATERFKAQVASGDPESLAIVEILERFGTKINMTPQMHEGINSVAAVENLYRHDQGTLLVRVLEVVQDAYGHMGGPQVNAAPMKAISWFLLRHPEADRQRLVERLQAEGIDEIDRKARSHKAAVGGAFWMNVYRALVECYNQRLPEGSRLEVRTRGYSKEPRLGAQYGTGQ